MLGLHAQKRASRGCAKVCRSGTSWSIGQFDVTSEEANDEKIQPLGLLAVRFISTTQASCSDPRGRHTIVDRSSGAWTGALARNGCKETRLTQLWSQGREKRGGLVGHGCLRSPGRRKPCVLPTPLSLRLRRQRCSMPAVLQ